MVLAVGDRVFRGEQEFKCVGHQSYVRKDGKETVLLVLESACCYCGTSFTQIVSMRVRSQDRLRHRCKKHRKFRTDNDPEGRVLLLAHQLVNEKFPDGRDDLGTLVEVYTHLWQRFHSGESLDAWCEKQYSEYKTN
ncbi:hypothetical protein [Aquamicrobium soli]|uniref:Transposase n=1 Tax=Aquamicrobium soli TaxID=1811518 RepID=A0ABV7K3X4_9HYPH